MHHWHRQTAISLICAALTLLSAHSPAATGDAPIRLVIGDSVATVQQALRTSAPPEPTQGVGRNLSLIHLSDRGIWAFFDGAALATQFRFDSPFGAAIDGVNIGASIAEVAAALGTPLREIPLPATPLRKSYLYHLDSGTTLIGEFDEHQQLMTIRVMNGAVSFAENAVSATRQNPITHLTIPGSLAVTQNLNCVALDAVDHSVQPPDLYHAVGVCLTSDRRPEAIALFMLAGLQIRFDAARVRDKTAGQAGQVMIMNTFKPLPPDEREKFSEDFKAAYADPSTMARVCAFTRQLGPPTYYPDYMILHGIKAFAGDPHTDALVASFDAQATWSELQRTFLKCAPIH